MLGSTTLYTVVVALALSSQAKFHGLSRRAPAGWAYGYLEDYHTYHIRYLAIGCQFKHGGEGKHGQTQFFQDCCHPMLGTETLEKNRPAHCVPGAAALLSASLIEPTANPTSIAPPASATKNVQINAVEPTASAAAPETTAAADEEDCDDDAEVEDDEEFWEGDQDVDDEEDCEDNEVASSPPSSSVEAAPTPTPTPVPSPVAAPVSSSPAAPASSAAPSSEAVPAPAASSEAVPAPAASSEAVPAPAASSEAVPAPAVSSEAVPAPAPSSEAEPVMPSSAEAPAAEPTAAPSTGNEEFTGGQATFYYQNGVAGACGKPHGDDELVAALDYRRYGDLGKQSDLCGKYVVITNPKNGKEVTALIADACPSCNNNNSIDLSQAAFTKIATEAEGIVDITWHFA